MVVVVAAAAGVGVGRAAVKHRLDEVVADDGLARPSKRSKKVLRQSPSMLHRCPAEF